MAERANATYPVLRSLAREFADFNFPTFVKLGITTDTGESKEHLWFEVHETLDESIEATLANQPYEVSSMKEGDRGRHSVELITDWMMMTPAGTMNSRSSAAARMVREDPERIRELMREES